MNHVGKKQSTIAVNNLCKLPVLGTPGSILDLTFTSKFNLFKQLFKKKIECFLFPKLNC